MTHEMEQCYLKVHCDELLIHTVNPRTTPGKERMYSQALVIFLLLLLLLLFSELISPFGIFYCFVF